MDLQSIINEADLLVPNEVPLADKIVVLNALNQDFFNVVKIPRVLPLTPIKDESAYTISTEVRLKNIDLVMVGIIKYHELIPGITNPLQNTYTFDDSTHILTLRPAPYSSGLQGVLRYSRIATTAFTSSVLTAVPDAPEEYHYSYYIGLASFLANAMDDAGKSTMYETQYKAAWNKAAQNYTGSAVT
ncbi:hypothetical protein [Paenibacillus jilunlii]|uniref:Uncharacterized protein n=1 Tax=Paenibacillus jilunlii TaxID=682956 RepID=A0A1H0ADD9_9BACL|nr:hypothetical protein [Paenibacillus jilunlii]KWX79915.1 hypothetical protein AML91_01735 [Paenibacillus jilunlii]SDN31427.1 hypothetical protein SAMN05216191_13713 [Paenibacillus jilunlii]